MDDDDFDSFLSSKKTEAHALPEVPTPTPTPAAAAATAAADDLFDTDFAAFTGPTPAAPTTPDVPASAAKSASVITAVPTVASTVLDDDDFADFAQPTPSSERITSPVGGAASPTEEQPAFLVGEIENVGHFCVKAASDAPSESGGSASPSLKDTLDDNSPRAANQDTPVEGATSNIPAVPSTVMDDLDDDDFADFSGPSPTPADVSTAQDRIASPTEEQPAFLVGEIENVGHFCVKAASDAPSESGGSASPSLKDTLDDNSPRAANQDTPVEGATSNIPAVPSTVMDDLDDDDFADFSGPSPTPADVSTAQDRIASPTEEQPAFLVGEIENVGHFCVKAASDAPSESGDSASTKPSLKESSTADPLPQLTSQFTAASNIPAAPSTVADELGDDDFADFSGPSPTPADTTDDVASPTEEQPAFLVGEIENVGHFCVKAASDAPSESGGSAAPSLKDTLDDNSPRAANQDTPVEGATSNIPAVPSTVMDDLDDDDFADFSGPSPTPADVSTAQDRIASPTEEQPAFLVGEIENVGHFCVKAASDAPSESGDSASTKPSLKESSTADPLPQLTSQFTAASNVPAAPSTVADELGDDDFADFSGPSPTPADTTDDVASPTEEQPAFLVGEIENVGHFCVKAASDAPSESGDSASTKPSLKESSTADPLPQLTSQFTAASNIPAAPSTVADELGDDDFADFSGPSPTPADPTDDVASPTEEQPAFLVGEIENVGHFCVKAASDAPSESGGSARPSIEPSVRTDDASPTPQFTDVASNIPASNSVVGQMDDDDFEAFSAPTAPDVTSPGVVSTTANQPSFLVGDIANVGHFCVKAASTAAAESGDGESQSLGQSVKGTEEPSEHPAQSLKAISNATASRGSHSVVDALGDDDFVDFAEGVTSPAVESTSGAEQPSFLVGDIANVGHFCVKAASTVGAESGDAESQSLGQSQALDCGNSASDSPPLPHVTCESIADGAASHLPVSGSVAGFDEDDFADFAAPSACSTHSPLPATSVEQPSFLVGEIENVGHFCVHAASTVATEIPDSEARSLGQSTRVLEEDRDDTEPDSALPAVGSVTFDDFTSPPTATKHDVNEMPSPAVGQPTFLVGEIANVGHYCVKAASTAAAESGGSPSVDDEDDDNADNDFASPDANDDFGEFTAPPSTSPPLPSDVGGSVIADPGAATPFFAKSVTFNSDTPSAISASSPIEMNEGVQDSSIEQPAFSVGEVANFGRYCVPATSPVTVEIADSEAPSMGNASPFQNAPSFGTAGENDDDDDDDEFGELVAATTAPSGVASPLIAGPASSRGDALQTLSQSSASPTNTTAEVLSKPQIDQPAFRTGEVEDYGRYCVAATSPVTAERSEVSASPVFPVEDEFTEFVSPEQKGRGGGGGGGGGGAPTVGSISAQAPESVFSENFSEHQGIAASPLPAPCQDPLLSPVEQPVFKVGEIAELGRYCVNAASPLVVETGGSEAPSASPQQGLLDDNDFADFAAPSANLPVQGSSFGGANAPSMPAFTEGEGGELDSSLPLFGTTPMGVSQGSRGIDEGFFARNFSGDNLQNSSSNLFSESGVSLQGEGRTGGAGSPADRVENSQCALVSLSRGAEALQHRTSIDSISAHIAAPTGSSSSTRPPASLTPIDPTLSSLPTATTVNIPAPRTPGSTPNASKSAVCSPSKAFKAVTVVGGGGGGDRAVMSASGSGTALDDFDDFLGAEPAKVAVVGGGAEGAVGVGQQQQQQQQPPPQPATDRRGSGSTVVAPAVAAVAAPNLRDSQNSAYGSLDHTHYIAGVVQAVVDGSVKG